MNTTNFIILTGRLGEDPKVHNFENGGGVASLSIATNSTYKNKQGEKITETEWTDCRIFYNYETIEKYVKKGDLLQVSGTLKTNKWEDKDGNKRSSKYVFVDSFTLMSEKKVAGNNEAESVPNTMMESEQEENNSLPF